MTEPQEPVKDEEAIKSPEAQSPTEVTILTTDLEKLTEDAKEFKDKYLRLLAEIDNTRKRLQKEKQDLMRFAVRDVLLEILHPIDHMEKALAHSENMSHEVKHWAAGFKMILTQFKEVLTLHGVHAVESVGMAFDPHQHEAVEMVERTDVAPGTILEEFIKGYRMGDMVIRPARVKVAKAPPEVLKGGPEKV